MPRTSKTDQELGYLRSAWEELEDQAIEYGFITTAVMIPTISRGVWSISFEARSKDTNDSGIPLRIERSQFRFPSGRQVTFAGELWSVLHRFTNQIAEARDSIARQG